MKPPTHPMAQALLAPLAGLYGALTTLRNRYYDRATSGTVGALPVISVGNITAGGTGKTPLVAWIAQQLQADGVRPGVVSRGYGGTAGAGPLTVSDGESLLCSSSACGDEPYLLASVLRDVPIVVGSDRVRGVQAAASLGAQVAILDDGFQHRRLRRDLDIVLIDATHPFGNGRLLPAGFLRESLTGLSRADVVLITRSEPGETSSIERIIRQYNDSAPILLAGHRRVGYRDLIGETVTTPERAIAFCGIGNPERFRRDLEADGIDVVEFQVHRDHHPYSEDQIADLGRRAAKLGAPLVTTEKDLARLTTAVAGAAGAEIFALRIEADIFEPAPLLERLRAVHSEVRP